MRFVKMQGIGNDYIYVFCAQGWPEGLPALARRLSDRHFGIGGDGLVLIAPGEETDFRMRMFNSDGSEGEMCGNAARCVGKYVHDRGLTDKTALTLATAAGLRRLELRLDEAGRTASVRVDMGTPRLRPEEIPMRAAGEPGEGIRLRTAAREMRAIDGVQSVEGNSTSGSVLITYDAGFIPRERLFAVGEAWALYLDAVNDGRQADIPRV